MKKLSSKLIEFAGHGIFAILIVMAVLLYKERLFADASYYAFHAINSGFFHVEHGRIVLALSQIVPLIGYYLHLPLQWLLVLSSIGHEVFYYSIFLILIYFIKDYRAALLLILVHLIGQLWLYYSPMLEICYGAALAVLFYSILSNGKYKNDFWLIVLLLSQWFVMTSHLENFLLIGLAIGYDILNRGWHKRIHISVISLSLIGLLIEFLTFSEYEAAKVFSNEPKSNGLAKLFDLNYWADVNRMFLEYFPELTVFLLLSFIYLIYKKEFVKLFLMLASVAALLLAVNLSADANEFSRYHESMYNPLVFVLSFFAVFEISMTNNVWFKRALFLIFLFIVANRISWTWNAGENLRKRSAQLERLVDYVQELGDSKYLIESENFQKQYSYIAWSNPIESLLYSAIDGKDKSVTISTIDDYEFNDNLKKLNDSSYIFRRFEIVPHSFLNPRYFLLDKSAYSKLNNTGIEELDVEKFANNLSVKVIDTNSVFSADTTYLKIELDNTNSEKLPSSLEDQVYIAYHLYQDGESIKWDGLRTPIEVDLFGSYQQHIKFASPETPGVYQIVPDIVIEGKAWFMLKNKHDLVVR